MIGEVDKGLFWLNAWTEVHENLQDYNSKTGHPALNIDADLFGRFDKRNIGNFKKIDSKLFNTPYELAKWTKQQIDNFREEDEGDEGGWEDAPIDPNLEPVLVPVRPRFNKN